MDPEKIRVVVAEDQAAFRHFISAVIDEEPDLEVVGQASDGEEAIALTTEHAPHVVLMDVRMPKLSGIAAARVLNEVHPNTKVLMLTVSDEEEDLFEAIKAGASGYLLKDVDPADVVNAVRYTHNGQAVVSPSMALKLMKELARSVKEADDDSLRPLLTNPEVSVLRYLANGSSSTEAAAKLGITESMVNNHVQNVLQKMHLHDRMQAAVEAAQRLFATSDDVGA